MCRHLTTQSLVKNLISIKSFFFITSANCNKGHNSDRQAQEISTKSKKRRRRKGFKGIYSIKNTLKGKESPTFMF